MRIERILAPTDFSTVSLDALEYAASLARNLGAEMTLLYVVDTTYGVPPDWYSSPEADRVLEQGRQAARRQLDRLGARIAESGLTVHTEQLEGPAAAQIVKAAQSLHADWIVMGTHGRSGRQAAVLGSVAQRVVQTSACPVLTIPTIPSMSAKEGWREQ